MTGAKARKILQKCTTSVFRNAPLFSSNTLALYKYLTYLLNDILSTSAYRSLQVQD